MRVVIVDDDEWIRRGRRDGLAAMDDIDVVDTLTPEAATSRADWSNVDAVVVDAYDQRQASDRYPGVGVVEAIRRSRNADETLILVVSGHILEPLLRLRMAEAGADFFYAHLDLPDPLSLAEALRRPDLARRAGPGDTTELAAYGLRPWSKPNAAIRQAEQAGYLHLFTAEGSQKASGASRRAMIHARDELARLARLEPSLGDNERRPGDVTWRDVARFVNRALGRHRDGSGPRGGPS
jgi:DNA-binding response OmpR family regulator